MTNGDWSRIGLALAIFAFGVAWPVAVVRRFRAGYARGEDALVRREPTPWSRILTGEFFMAREGNLYGFTRRTWYRFVLAYFTSLLAGSIVYGLGKAVGGGLGPPEFGGLIAIFVAVALTFWLLTREQERNGVGSEQE